MTRRDSAGARRSAPASAVAAPSDASRSLLASALLFALWTIALIELRELFVGTPWTLRALMTAAGVLLTSGLLARLVPGRRALAWLSGAIVGVGLLALWMSLDGRLVGWLAQPRALAQQTSLAMARGVPPVTLEGALLDAVLAAWLLGLLLSSLLLVRFGRGFAAGLVPALVMLGPALITSLRVPASLLLVTGLLLLLLLWAEAPMRVGRWRGIAAAGVALALAAGFLAVLPPSRDRVWNTDAISASPVAAGVPDVTIALAEDLRRRSNAIAFEYTGSYGNPSRFTLAVLSDFRRGTWLPEDEPDAEGRSVGVSRSSLRAEEARGAWPFGRAPGVDVRVVGLRSAWLPLPPTADRVEAVRGSFDPEQWIWGDGTVTARSETALTRQDQEYRVRLADGVVDEAGQYFPPGVDPAGLADPDRYLELPEELPAAITEATEEVARQAEASLELFSEVTGGIDTIGPDGIVSGMRGAEVTVRHLSEAGDEVEVIIPNANDMLLSEATLPAWATASALEGWFRSGEFVYDEQAPYEPGADPDDPYSMMEAFLAQRAGFCVHFASTYAVMARSLGLPTRVAVGYVARAQNTGWTPVRARELHAWPEVYLEGQGWTAFEPTPGGAGYRAETGEPYREDPDPDTGADDTPATQPTTPATQEPDPALDDPETDLAATPRDQGDARAGTLSRLGIPLAVLATLVGLLCLTPLVRILRRRGRRRGIARGDEPAARAWAEFMDTAVDLGLYTPGTSSARARTPEAVVEYLAEAGAFGRETGGDGERAARGLAEAVVEERYAGVSEESGGTIGPNEPGGLSGSSGPALLAHLGRATRALRARAGRRARAWAALLPRSLGRRAMRPGRTADTPGRDPRTLEAR
ncbi:transglutaminase family protein [Leucobacter tenebrionis]|uniref:transglutaminase family protein n=1 Tax=Leucobacter tenebrionis TaxID=2873270 RepID=UPI001CA77DDA|nr:transglutaminase domain-containing protein [Leucobacter tenebrionis]QZY52577.1 DUF3488 and transglutaminase-like domain-containing protein [Leucobacter tenebrionis]